MHNVHSSDPSENRAGFAAGQMVGECFILREEVSSFGDGFTWLAGDEVSGREVMLHLLPADKLTREAFEELKGTVKRVRQLIHPHVQRIHGCFEDRSWVGVVSDPVPATTLAHLIGSKGVVRVEEIAPWIAHLSETLDDVHRLRFVHGALELDDLRLHADGHIILANFGWARAVRGTATPAQPTAADDVRAFGSIIETLLTGHSTPDELLRPTINESRRAMDLPPVPENWERLVTACLAPKCQDRPKSCGQALAVLAAATARELQEHGQERHSESTGRAGSTAQSSEENARSGPAMEESKSESTRRSTGGPAPSPWKPPFVSNHIGTLERPKSRARWVFVAAVLALAAAGWLSRGMWWEKSIAGAVTNSESSKMPYFATAEKLPPAEQFSAKEIDLENAGNSAATAIPGPQIEPVKLLSESARQTQSLHERMQALDARISRYERALDALRNLEEIQAEGVIAEITTNLDVAKRERDDVLLEIATASNVSPNERKGTEPPSTVVPGETEALANGRRDSNE